MSRSTSPGVRDGRNGRSGKALGAVPDFVKPTRRVRILVVGCPDCGADIGEKCSTAKGKPTGPHPSRTRMAHRLDNEMRADQ